MMLCSGGGGRCDYEALKYFTEFWPSDNTDAVERIFIQWGFSHFFPSKSLAAHVTTWGKQPLKFRVDVAMMGKIGFDIRLNEMNENEQEFCRNAVANYKRLAPVISEGAMYRLQSPYDGAHAAALFSDEARSHAVLFAFDMHPRYRENILPLKLQGLASDKSYTVEEINLMPGGGGRRGGGRDGSGTAYSGEYLMTVGLNVFSSSHTVSHVFEIKEVR
jgi:alpha-galactosidase